MQGDHVFMLRETMGIKMEKLFNEKYNIPFYLSKERSFLKFYAFPLNKHLPKETLDKLNKM